MAELQYQNRQLMLFAFICSKQFAQFVDAFFRGRMRGKQIGQAATAKRFNDKQMVLRIHLALHGDLFAIGFELE